MNRNLFKILAAIVILFILGILIFKFKISSNSVNNNNSSNIVATNDESTQPESPIIPAESASSIDTASVSPNIDNSDKSNFTFAIIGDTKSFKAGNPKGKLEKAVASLSKLREKICGLEKCYGADSF